MSPRWNFVLHRAAERKRAAESRPETTQKQLEFPYAADYVKSAGDDNRKWEVRRGVRLPGVEFEGQPHVVSLGSGFHRDVAQPGSALAWGARGREFKSRRPDQSYAINLKQRRTRASRAWRRARALDEAALARCLHAGPHWLPLGKLIVLPLHCVEDLCNDGTLKACPAAPTLRSLPHPLDRGSPLPDRDPAVYPSQQDIQTPRTPATSGTDAVFVPHPDSRA